MSTDRPKRESMSLEDAVVYAILTQAAMLRAVCPVERGANWAEGASDGSVKPWGCTQK